MAQGSIERLNLQVVLPETHALDTSELKRVLQKCDPVFQGVEVEAGSIRFGAHTINCKHTSEPMKPEDVNAAFGDVRCDERLKDRVREHKAVAVLSYTGPETDAAKVYKLLLLVSAAFCACGALAVLNLNGHTCTDGRQLLRLLGESGWLSTLDKDMPVCFICSAVTAHCFEGNPNYFLRTYGNEFLNIPNVSALVPSRQWDSMHEKVIRAFENVSNYMLDSGKRISPGDTMDIDGTQLRFWTEAESAKTWGREVQQPLGPDEFFLESPTGLLTLEFKQPQSSILFLPGAGGSFFR